MRPHAETRFACKGVRPLVTLYRYILVRSIWWEIYWALFLKFSGQRSLVQGLTSVLEENGPITSVRLAVVIIVPEDSRAHLSCIRLMDSTCTMSEMQITLARCRYLSSYDSQIEFVNLWLGPTTEAHLLFERHRWRWIIGCLESVEDLLSNHISGEE